jgi:ribosomal protein S17E
MTAEVEQDRKGASPAEADLKWLHDLPALKTYLDRIGAEVKNFRKYTVEDQFAPRDASGKSSAVRRTVATIRLQDDGTIECKNKDFAPTEVEQAAIKEAVKSAKFPRSIIAKNVHSLRRKLNVGNADDLYVFFDAKGEVLFVQQRVTFEDGNKGYLPWSLFDDGEWRMMEPDGELPLFGQQNLKNAARVVLHEGAKAARAVDWLINSATKEAKEARALHPWIEDLKNVVHVGWIGGAANPHRTDWTPIKMLAPYVSVVVVCDNDRAGKEAVTAISRRLKGREVSAIMFDDNFPVGFDLADPFPEKLFKMIDGERVYRGPAFKDCLRCATWATEVKPNPSGKGRPITIMRNEFIEQWAWAVSPPVFVHRNNPARLLNDRDFNAQVRPFSDVEDTAALLRRHPSAQADVVAYEPGQPSGFSASDGVLRINTWMPTTLKVRAPARETDLKPWRDFMEQLIPDETDRHHLMRWLATLVAHPEIRMPYGILLISEAQGVGKGTLLEKIAAPLVGAGNVSTPSEREVVKSDFNSWIARKRLACVHEIYAGESKRAYNDIKSYITERVVRVNEKYQSNYETTNWAHFLASSNSPRALHMASEDRRWFVPGVTGSKLPAKYWTDFNEWLGNFGLEMIHHDLIEFARKHGPVSAGDEAPMSAAKRAMIEESKTEGCQLAEALAEKSVHRGQFARVDYSFVDASNKSRVGSFAELRAGVVYEMVVDRVNKPEKIVLVVDEVREWVAEKRNLQNAYGLDLNSHKLEGVATLRKSLIEGGLTQPLSMPGEQRRFKIDGRMRYVVANFPIPLNAKWTSIEPFRRKPKDLWPVSL